MSTFTNVDIATQDSRDKMSAATDQFESDSKRQYVLSFPGIENTPLNIGPSVIEVENWGVQSIHGVPKSLVWVTITDSCNRVMGEALWNNENDSAGSQTVIVRTSDGKKILNEELRMGGKFQCWRDSDGNSKYAFGYFKEDVQRDMKYHHALSGTYHYHDEVEGEKGEICTCEKESGA